MKEIIKKSKKGNNLEITLVIPLTKSRCNPYETDEQGIMDNIVGIIEDSFNKCGFAHLIDMEYAGKPDQWTDYFYLFNGGIPEFRKICKKLKIKTIED